MSDITFYFDIVIESYLSSIKEDFHNKPSQQYSYGSVPYTLYIGSHLPDPPCISTNRSK